MTEKRSFEIPGGNPLFGDVRLCGAKNSTLPIICAACLGERPTTLQNVPTSLNDVKVLVSLLREMGASIEAEGTVLTCARGSFPKTEIAPVSAERIRYSLLLLGMAVAVDRRMRIPLPGGCRIGLRKHDLHVMSLRALGHEVTDDHSGIAVRPANGKAAIIAFPIATTSGTENAILAALSASGVTEIHNGHVRPEVLDFIHFLRLMGAMITCRNGRIFIAGQHALEGGVTYSIMPAHDEAVTYFAAVGMAGGCITVTGIDAHQIPAELDALQQMGLKIDVKPQAITAERNGSLRGIELVTGAFPGVGSDMQPIFTALSTIAAGESAIRDTRFCDRFQYADELRRFGADIERSNDQIRVRGVSHLHPAEISSALDIRGSAAVLLAALAADGKSVLSNVYQLERGYHEIDIKLRHLGAAISTRTNEHREKPDTTTDEQELRTP